MISTKRILWTKIIKKKKKRKKNRQNRRKEKKLSSSNNNIWRELVPSESQIQDRLPLRILNTKLTKRFWCKVDFVTDFVTCKSFFINISFLFAAFTQLPQDEETMWTPNFFGRKIIDQHQKFLLYLTLRISKIHLYLRKVDDHLYFVH